MTRNKALMYGFAVVLVLAEVGFVAAQMQQRLSRTSPAEVQAPMQAPVETSKTSAAMSEDAAIRQVMIVQTTAWNTGKVDTFMQAYKDAPDTTFIGSKVLQGYNPILASYKKRFSSAQMGTLSFSELQVRLLDAKYALVTGRFHLSRQTDKKDKDVKNDGVFSLVWEKTDAGWKIILDHTS